MNQRSLCWPGAQSHRKLRNSGRCLFGCCGGSPDRVQWAEACDSAVMSVGNSPHEPGALASGDCFGDGELFGGFHKAARTTSLSRNGHRAGLADADARERPLTWAVSVERSACGIAGRPEVGSGSRSRRAAMSAVEPRRRVTGPAAFGDILSMIDGREFGDSPTAPDPSIRPATNPPGTNVSCLPLGTDRLFGDAV